jgi:hypothetical protein
MMLPCALVERSAFGVFEIAKLVVVALVAVALVTMMPPLKVRSDDVALLGNGSCPVPVASVPQLNTPALLAFTSQLAELRFETINPVVDARPETARFVVVAFVVDALVAKREEKVFCALQVLAAYNFGIVDEASMKY